MRVLILGGAGDVGSYVTRALLQKGHDVTVLDRVQAAAATAKNRSIAYVQGDMADRTLPERGDCLNRLPYFRHIAQESEKEA